MPGWDQFGLTGDGLTEMDRRLGAALLSHQGQAKV